MHRTPALLSDLVPDLFFPDLEPEMGSQRPSDVNIDEFKNSKSQNLKFQISKFQSFQIADFKSSKFQISNL